MIDAASTLAGYPDLYSDIVESLGAETETLFGGTIYIRAGHGCVTIPRGLGFPESLGFSFVIQNHFLPEVAIASRTDRDLDSGQAWQCHPT